MRKKFREEGVAGSDYAVRTQVVSNDEGKTFLNIGIRNVLDPYDGISLYVSSKQAVAIGEMILKAAKEMKERGQ